MSFKPPPLSARRAVRQFYDANPSEELTLEQLRAKFGISACNARRILCDLKRDGLVRSVIVYRGRAA